LVVAVKALEHFAPRYERLLAEVIEDRLPQRTAALGLAFAQALRLALIAAQRDAEHVRADLPAHALSLDLAREIEKHLTRDPRERRAHTARGRELRDQHRGLAHDRVDQQLDVHPGLRKRDSLYAMDG